MINLKEYADSALKNLKINKIRILYYCTYPDSFTPELAKKELDHGMFYGSAMYDGENLIPDDGDTYDIDMDVLKCELYYDESAKKYYIESLEKGMYLNK